MIIYKITNTLNNKCYIGQTSGSFQDRWTRHKADAFSNRLDTHFARALRKYDLSVWKTEVLDDTAKTEKELNEKEYYYIHYYNALDNGYNETDSTSKSGGNTYRAKTEEEMDTIKEKIRQTKLGGKNPQAVKVKCKNEETGEILHFNSMAEVRDYFKQKNHQFVSRRCRGEIQSLWQEKWNFAYEDSDFKQLAKYKKQRKSVSIKVKNLLTDEEKNFPSYAAAERYFNLPNKGLSGKAYKHKGEKTFIIRKHYLITILD